MRRFLLFFIACALVGCGDAKERKIISEVETLMKFREYSKAMMVLKEALKEEPENKKLLRYRILVLLKAEQPDLAYAAYRQMKEKISSHDDVLLNALENEDATIRATAAQVLSVAKEPESVKALIKQVKDSDETVRRAAINALRELKDPRATEALLKALKDESWFVRGEAAQALSAIGAEEALPALFQALHDSDAYVKQAAGAALIALANPDNLEIFAQQLSHEDWETRVIAAIALAKQGNDRGKSVLIQTLEEAKGDAWHRRLCVEALTDIKALETLPLLQKIAEEDQDSQVRLAAITALGLMPDFSSLPILDRIKKDSDASLPVRTHADEARRLIETTLRTQIR
jgi:HEAT repeat protein